ncbi:response regulator transcription factor [Pseudonocardia sp. RS010]|uniref:response regulator transcription factor n=1 Tax=Pseudonocardia sp. RS010 TaxID=3385979 RepID=UPI0039A2DD64
MSTEGVENAMTGRDDGDWLEFTAELLREPLTELPMDRIALKLRSTFHACAVAINEPDESGMFAGDLYPLDAALEGRRADMEEWRSSRSVLTHPILRYYSGTGDVRAVQVAGMESRFTRPWAVTGGEALFRECAVQQQLSIPVERGPNPKTLVAGRDTPFTEQEMQLAGTLSRLLGAIDRQARAYAAALRSAKSGPDDVASAIRLTPRERSVLGLLAEGLTAGAIARRLDIAERTVHKHLERCYSKLGVTDRLTAVLAAQRLGLVAA